MANVLFKRGLQADLPALPNQSSNDVVDGALYFTTDSKRLFLGNGSTLLPIAEGITSVASATSLPAAAEHAGEFYYIAPAETGTADRTEVGNILAYSDGTRWLQVNQSTHVDSIGHTASAVTADQEVRVRTLVQQGGIENKTADINIISGSANVKVNVENGKIKISVDEDKDTLYELAATATTTVAGADTVSGAILTLTPTGSTMTATAATSSIPIWGAGGIAISTSNDAITIGVDPSGISAVSNFVMGNGNGIQGGSGSQEGFYGQLQLSDSTYKRSSINPEIKYGALDEEENPTQSVRFVDGVADLQVYSRSDVDNLIDRLERGMDAMTYIGTTSEIPTGNNISNGDTWKASTSITYNGTEYPAGSLIIALGQEDAATGYIPAGNLSFDIVSGDTTDTTYQVNKVSHGITLSGKTGDATNIGGIQLAEVVNGAVKLTDTDADGKSRVVQIDLDNVTYTTTTGTASAQEKGQNLVINAITAIDVDGYGRVKSATVTPFTVLDTDNALDTVAFTANAANNVATVSLLVKEAGGTQKQDAFTLQSTGSLSVTGNDKAVTVDLVWGSFQ